MNNIVEVEEKVKDIIVKEIKEIASIEQLDIKAPLKDYGIHSMLMVKIMIALENEFDFSFDNDDFNIENYGNIEALINYISARV